MNRVPCALLLAATTACGYQDIELSPCWPDCGAAVVSDGGTPLELEVVWTTPHAAALRWSGAIPAEVTGYALTLGSVGWDATHDPRLAARTAAEAVVLGLAPATAHPAILIGLTAGGGRLTLARGTVTTPAEAANTRVIYAEGDAPARTVFVLGGAPITHQGASALWFTADAARGTDGPGVSGLTIGGAALEAARDRAFLELWLRVLPSGGGLTPLTTRVVVDGTSYGHDGLVVPSAPGWYQLEVPLDVHRREGGAALAIGGGATITGVGLQAAWPSGATVVVDDLAVRY